MRVLFISPFAELGGSERCLLDMLAMLGRAAPEIERRLLLMAEGPLEREAGALGAKVTTLPLPRELGALGESGSATSFARGVLAGLRVSRSALGYLREFDRVLGSIRPDVVHSNGMKAHVLTATLARRRCPIVLHMHDLVGQRRLSKHLLALLCSRQVRVVANSSAVLHDCAKVLPRARVSLVRNAVDTAYFSPGPGEPEWLSAMAGMAAPGPSTTCFALVSTFARWKGHDLVLRAAARALELEPGLDARWYIVGEPIYTTSGGQFSRDELVGLARELGIEDRVGFAPFVRDVARVFRSADVVVHASNEREAFGRTIVEAMACQRPVIACAAGGAAELFEDGVTALGFPPGDVAALARAMLRLAREPALRGRMARAGREHAVSAFDRERLGPELVDLYRGVLAGGSA